MYIACTSTRFRPAGTPGMVSLFPESPACSSEEVQAKYQRNLKQSQARIPRMASQAPHVGQLLAAIVRAFIAAGKESIGMKRIVPGAQNAGGTKT